MKLKLLEHSTDNLRMPLNNSIRNYNHNFVWTLETMSALALNVLLSFAVAIRAQMEAFIVGGAFAKIHAHPYAAYLAINCVDRNGENSEWACGSSIINQRILLTAAHCVNECNNKTRIVVRLGNKDRKNGTIRSSTGFIQHALYDDVTLSYDIALVRMSRPVKLHSRISRVAIIRLPPYNESAIVSGWGLTNVKTEESSQNLKEVDQKVWKYTACKKLIGYMPKGTICASSKNPEAFAAQGDSGSGLIVRGYIQIGLVSFKISQIAQNVVIYTDVGYFYNWITYNAHRLFCYIH